MTILFKNACVVNEGTQRITDVLVKNGRIEKIADTITVIENADIHDLKGDFLLPGAIDDQVHFREPGLTHKGNIQTESYAAVAGGITSFMEMPNTIPNAITQELLEEKYQIAAKTSAGNYSFFMGATNDNYEEVMKTDIKNVCGVKIFMGSSTGNMLVDNEQALSKLFSNVETVIATHCEDEATIKANLEKAKEIFGENIPVEQHPVIRSAEACYLSSSLAIKLAKKYGTRLHILHISTEKEIELFDNITPLEKKSITAEVCIHHLWFSDKDYPVKGNFIKWNPAVKSEQDREALWKGLLDNHIDVIATDHAPHTIEEKSQPYLQAPSGGPLVQHALPAMLDKYEEGKISIERIVEKMAHAPAICFRLENRGFIREGYFADLVVVKKSDYQVTKNNILYKCGWSPFEGHTFKYTVDKTFINGKLAYSKDQKISETFGQRLTFDR
ncbi:MAG: dihydroorotase [Flavobacteriia bacterium]|nr:dihydroorotase [Flavobacteriia bacterium]OJX34899.1 MAG: dihydroorotase [Flavobacteriia bacterium 40-80]